MENINTNVRVVQGYVIFMKCDVDTQYQYRSPQSPYGFLNESGLSFSPKLTLYTLTSVCIFSILFSKEFLRCRHGEFV